MGNQPRGGAQDRGQGAGRSAGKGAAGAARGAGRRARGGNRRRNARLSAALFVTLGLVGAFLVSAIAGIRTGDTTGSDTMPSHTARGVAGADRNVTGADAGTGPLGEGDARTLPAGTLVRIEVLNGAGAPGLARLATSRLRGEGFDVVFFGNAARFDHARSVVLDRTGDPARARAVAAALGIDSVATVPEPGLLLDVSVVLGADWPPPPPPGAPLDRFHRLLAPADTAP